jgi:hypothetical protein
VNDLAHELDQHAMIFLGANRQLLTTAQRAHRATQCRFWQSICYSAIYHSSRRGTDRHHLKIGDEKRD